MDFVVSELCCKEFTWQYCLAADFNARTKNIEHKIIDAHLVNIRVNAQTLKG